MNLSLLINLLEFEAEMLGVVRIQYTHSSVDKLCNRPSFYVQRALSSCVHQESFLASIFQSLVFMHKHRGFQCVIRSREGFTVGLETFTFKTFINLVHRFIENKCYHPLKIMQTYQMTHSSSTMFVCCAVATMLRTQIRVMEVEFKQRIVRTSPTDIPCFICRPMTIDEHCPGLPFEVQWSSMKKPNEIPILFRVDNKSYEPMV